MIEPKRERDWEMAKVRMLFRVFDIFCNDLIVNFFVVLMEQSLCRRRRRG